MLRRLVTVAAVIGSIGIGAPAAIAGETPREVHIGALLSLTGAGETLGDTSEAALKIAAQRWNDSPQGKKVKVVLDVENTNLEAEQAQAALTRLADKGVRIAIGPQSSSEVAAISEQADARGVLLVSQGSTASSLGLPDDNVYRFVPTDRVEGRASVDLMLKNGATTIVPMWRNDRGNNGLADSVRAAATASGSHRDATASGTSPTRPTSAPRSQTSARKSKPRSGSAGRRKGGGVPGRVRGGRGRLQRGAHGHRSRRRALVRRRRFRAIQGAPRQRTGDVRHQREGQGVPEPARRLCPSPKPSATRSS